MMKDLSILDSLITGRVEPHIYAFTTNTIPNYLKVGDTYRPVSKRLSEWREYFPNLEQKFEGSAKITDDVYFRDYSVHSFLETERHRTRLSLDDLPADVYYSREFFRGATVVDVEEAIADIRADYDSKTGKYHYYNATTQLPTIEKYASTGMWDPRPNQDKTIKAFKKAIDNGRKHLLMYAVMRFGKSFTSMCCAKEMGAKLVVVVSAKADVCDEWRKTVESAENFRNEYEFLSASSLERNYNIINELLDNPTSPKKVVVFLTLQDLQGENIKDKHAQIFGRKIDLLLVDETHFGARAEKYGAVLRASQGEKLSKEEKYAVEDILESTKEFDVDVTVHLSGTPYRILMSDEFDREQDLIAFYQFTDIVSEQEAWDKENLAQDEPKEEWENPYFGFPQMIRFAFNPNESSRKRMADLRASGMSDAFSALLRPKSIVKTDDNSHKLFINEQEILELLEVIDGSKEDEELLGFLDYDKIKSGKMCRHIIIVLPYCASCDALEELIRKNAERFKNLNEYEIINISGVDNPNRYKRPGDIKRAITDFEAAGKKTITLTVNRMLTGSTVPEWDTMLFLKDTASPQEYDQAIFRLQNQYIRELTGDDGQVVKFNMKPQTLLVDFDPDRVFIMQEQKAQVYNVNTDEAGNTKLEDRIREELRISPIIVMNADKLSRVEPRDIIKAVSEYSKKRGVAEETVEIPVDMSLLDIAEIRAAIERENELGSKAGLTIKGAEGDGDDMDTPTEDNASTKAFSEPDKPAEVPSTDPTGDTAPAEEKAKDAVKQFRSYYARILFFAFLTKNVVISLSDIINCIDEDNNARIAKNLGISKIVLQGIFANADKFVIRRLDYKIHNLNQLSHDDSVDPITRASVSVQKFGKLGESEVITPRDVCNDMVSMIDDADWLSVIENGNKILDIAGKAGEFALAIFEKYTALGYDIGVLKDLICTIPTSGITYEFTRMIYEILGLNVDNIATHFTSYDLLGTKSDDGNIDYAKIKMLLGQNKSFSDITMKEEITEGEKIVNFDVIVGNPPYQEIVGNESSNKALGKQLFPYFIMASARIANLSCLITPSRWFTGNGQDGSFPKLREFAFNNNHFKKITNHLTNDVFQGISVGSINYYLYDNSYVGDVEFKEVVGNSINSVKRPLFEQGMDKILPMNIMSYYIKKVQGHPEFKSLTEITTSRNPFGVPDSNARLLSVSSKQKDKTHTIPMLCAFEEIMYVAPDIVRRNTDIFGKWKIFTSKMNGGAGTLFDDKKVSIIGRSFVGEPNTICSGALIAIGSFDTRYEAENLKKYMETKFLRFMVGLMKSSQALYQNVYQFVPMQDFTANSDIDWSKPIEEIDTQLYEKYGLSKEEVDYIEAIIKPME